MKVVGQRKKLKSLNLSLIGINSALFLNNSLCQNYKNLWEKSKKLWPDKFVDGFWTYNCSMRSKITETSIVCLIAHDDLEEFFPGNELVTIHGKFLAI